MKVRVPPQQALPPEFVGPKALAMQTTHKGTPPRPPSARMTPVAR